MDKDVRVALIRIGVVLGREGGALGNSLVLINCFFSIKLDSNGNLIEFGCTFCS